MHDPPAGVSTVFGPRADRQRGNGSASEKPQGRTDGPAALKNVEQPQASGNIEAGSSDAWQRGQRVSASFAEGNKTS
jgi:hypothetical protein